MVREAVADKAELALERWRPSVSQPRNKAVEDEQTARRTFLMSCLMGLKFSSLEISILAWRAARERVRDIRPAEELEPVAS
jgi:hypothetical protein